MGTRREVGIGGGGGGESGDEEEEGNKEVELERVGELEVKADWEGIGSRGRRGGKWRWREKNVEVNAQQK